MLTGALATWYLIPEVQYSNRESKTLGVLARGREQLIEGLRTQAALQNGEVVEMGDLTQRRLRPG